MAYPRPESTSPLQYLYRRVSPRFRHRLGKIPGVLPVCRFMIDSLLGPERAEDGLVLVNFQGFTMYEDPKEVTVGFRLGLYEQTTTFVFKRLLEPGDIVVDVGAHWGYFTLLAATLCGNKGKVFAFEPHPENYALLAKSIEANGFGNVAAIQKAVSNQSGTAKLLLASGSDLSSLRYVPPQFRLPPDSKDHLLVGTVALDDFFAQDSVHPKLIKMDIEGAEPLAYEGMRNIINGNRDVIVITEFLPDYLGELTAEDFLRTLSADGFHIVAMNDDLYQLEIGTIGQILKRAQENLDRGVPTNLLCSRERSHIEKVTRSEDPQSEFVGTPAIVGL